MNNLLLKKSILFLKSSFFIWVKLSVIVLIFIEPTIALGVNIDVSPSCNGGVSEFSGPGNTCTLPNVFIGDNYLVTLTPLDAGGPLSCDVTASSDLEWGGVPNANTILNSHNIEVVEDGNNVLIRNQTGMDIITPTTGSGIEITLQLRDNENPLCVTTEIVFTLHIQRKSVSVMLALDFSGSMNGTLANVGDLEAEAPQPITKIDGLRRAITLFTALATGDDSPILDRDTLGAVYFASSFKSSPSGLPSSEVWQFNGANNANLISDMGPGVIPASGATSMGSAILRSIDNLNDHFGPPGKTYHIILLSDGRQNRSPCARIVSGEDNTYQIFFDDDPGCDGVVSEEDTDEEGTSLIDGDDRIHISTIALFAPGEVMSNLQEIANNSEGRYYSNIPGAIENQLTLTQTFMQNLFEFLRDGSPQLVSFESGSMTNPSGSIQPRFNSEVESVTFLLSSRHQDSAHIQHRILYNGQDISNESFITNNTQINAFSRITTIPLPFSDWSGPVIEAGGNWEMQIVGEAGTYYEAAVFVDEHKFDFEFSLGNQIYEVGDDINISANLSLLGSPVTEDVDITAFVLKPGEDLGTLLSTTNVPDFPDSTYILQTNNTNLPGTQYEGESLNGQTKLQILLQDPEFYQQLFPQSRMVKLTNQGDGKFTGVFSGAEVDVAGAYNVVFRLGDSIANLGYFQRTETHSTYVEFGEAEKSNSAIQYTTLLGKKESNKINQLSLRPRDTFGNFLGPAYASRIKIVLTDGAEATNVKDNLDGSYTYQIEGAPQGKNPEVTIIVMDDTLYDGKLNNLKNRFCFNFDIGITLPLNDFDSTHNPGFAAELGLAYKFTDNISLEVLGGLYTFDPDERILGSTAYLNLDLPLGSNGWGAFAGVGGGYYWPKNLTATPGWSVKGGIERSIGRNVSFKLKASYFNLNVPTQNRNFLAGTAGLGFAF